MSAIETRIARKLVKKALGKGYSISVNDGEETTLVKSTSEAVIMNELNSTEVDILYFNDKDGRYLGWVMLIWGNDEDLISDATYNDEMNELTDYLDL